MGFKEVFKTLQEIFPQIDARVLRAVSIEHSKDVDAAVEAIFEEIIPFFSENLSDSISLDNMSKESVSATQNEDVPLMKMDSSEEILMTSMNKYMLPPSNAFESSTHVNVHPPYGPDSLSDDSREQINQKDTSDDPDCQETATDKGLEVGTKISSDETSGYKLEDLDMGGMNFVSGHALEDEEMVDMSFVQEKDNSCSQTNKDNKEDNFSLHTNHSVGEPVSVTVQSPGPCPGNNDVGVEVAHTRNDSVTQSGLINISGVLDEAIAEARKNKKTLFSAMESVISMMREVQVREQAAEKSNVESANEVSHVSDQVEELKQMLKHSMEANDMHAGEVYGEKAILATELRELQSRVIFLSDERDKSLAVLDEMRHTLEMRLAAADDEIKRAEEEKQRKHKLAREALTEQELIMESVVQESKILKQQADENAKLREFLVDRGCVVDVLQGEIAVICQDVKLLKEKFDERVPLNKSFSSSQTSFLLASSSSSSQSFIPYKVESWPSQDDSIKPKQNANGGKQLFVDESSNDDSRALLEEGWDFLTTSKDEYA